MKRVRAKTRNGLIAALDVGTNKVCCFIARADDEGNLRIVGIGHQVSDGVRGGMIIDMGAAEMSILKAVHAAEQMAGETIRKVIVNLSGGNPASQTRNFEVSIAGREVAEADVRRVLGHGRAQFESAERELVHCIPVGYTIDGSTGIRAPQGMYGERLGVNMHMVTATSGAVRTLRTCVARCHLDVEALVVSSYAAGLSCLVEDERNLGATVIDMGGGTTSIAVFYDGKLVHADGVPIGGAHVTSDIARGLTTPLAHAERMKTLYGSAISSPSDESEIIDVPLVGEEDRAEARHVPRAIPVSIIGPRIEETFELIGSRLEMSGFERIAGRRVVLTGGASQLQGVAELAARVLDKQVRHGRPLGITGLAEATGGPAFATCAGLLTYAVKTHAEAPAGRILDLRARGATEEPSSRFGRFGLWLRENF
ncbi:MAG: cell division protein FtsA [Alphaproteobacteria bacterium]